MSPPRSSDSEAPLATLRGETARLHLHLDHQVERAFSVYLDLLLQWNERAGLTSVTDRDEIQRRHFSESLALLVALRTAGVLAEGEPVRLADLGPGGGFPGLPMRLVDPALHLTLIESQERRCAFLRHVMDTLDLADVEVIHARAEEAGRDPGLREQFDVVTARALAPLRVLVEYALPLLRTGGVLAAPKGSRAEEEFVEAVHGIEELGGEALAPITLPLPEQAPPQTVVLIRRVRPLDDRYPRRPGIPSKRPL